MSCPGRKVASPAPFPPSLSISKNYINRPTISQLQTHVQHNYLHQDISPAPSLPGLAPPNLLPRPIRWAPPHATLPTTALVGVACAVPSGSGLPEKAPPCTARPNLTLPLHLDLMASCPEASVDNPMAPEQRMPTVYRQLVEAQEVALPSDTFRMSAIWSSQPKMAGRPSIVRKQSVAGANVRIGVLAQGPGSHGKAILAAARLQGAVRAAARGRGNTATAGWSRRRDRPCWSRRRLRSRR